ncbi:hypothetical protein C8J35_12111 [Rhizobium sp. PP-F2F-G38]|nr:hypothetical protein C8J35_12111 [Rhizobium sp. PP-F2F-G38]
MSNQFNAHPNRYPRLVELARQRVSTALEASATTQKDKLSLEFSAVAHDEIGFDARMDYAGTVSFVWEKFMASERLMYRMVDKLPDLHDIACIEFPELLALRLPDTFYAHFGEDVGICLEDVPDVFVDGVYFWHTTDFGDPLYLYVVACGLPECPLDQLSLQELTIATTRVAIGTIEPHQYFYETFDGMIGDPAVCRTVANTVLKDVIALSLAMIADPQAVPDLTREVNLSAAPAMRRRN